jgi:hypothetical protein
MGFVTQIEHPVTISETLVSNVSTIRSIRKLETEELILQSFCGCEWSSLLLLLLLLVNAHIVL